MEGQKIISDLFDQELLIPPVSEVPSAMELYRTVATFSGVAGFPKTKGLKLLQEEIPPVDHFVFVLVDGLGLQYQPLFPKSGFFEKFFKRELRALFPSTTATVLTSMASGAWPAEHSVTGWWTYFSEYSRIIAPLLGIERETEASLKKLGLSLHELIPVASILPAFFRQCHTFLPRPMQKGPYADWSRGRTPITSFVSPEQGVRRIRKHIKRLKSASYNYVYTTDIDTLAHKYGTDSEQVANALILNDQFLASLRDALPDSAKMIVTADHGTINVPDDRHFLLQHDDILLSYLSVPPTGESRNPIFHVRPGSEDEFARVFADSVFGEYFELLDLDDIEELKLFGPEPLSTHSRNHLGSFIAIAKGPFALEYVGEGQEPNGHRGFHGGLSPEEMRVPLFIA